jgi:nucleotide-binding universal stress UspA family protein
MAFHKILCSVDFSDPSREALRLACTLAREAKGTLTIAHAWDVSAFAFVGEGVLLTSLYEDIPAAAEKELVAWKREAEALGAPSVATRLLQGATWAEVVELLEREPFDAVVVGTHGRTGVKRAVIGSVAEKIVRHAPCTVIVARQREAR